MTPATPEEIAAGLTEVQRRALLQATPADCAEFWALEPIDDPRLASSDLVLTDLGVAVRRALLDRTK